ncbi:MAG: c-type cytochrome [Pusillimonas sp.]
MNTPMRRFTTALLALSTGLAASGLAHAQSTAIPFTPPPADSIPDNEFGKMVKLGQDIFLQTKLLASPYVGNSMNCVNCHLDAGRLAGSAPMWAGYVAFPAYRSKSGKVETYSRRIQECFIYSMNGKLPPADSDVVVALETYMYWLATNAPTGATLEGRGYKRLPEPAQKPDYVRGQKVYAQHCALCHGADGAGQRVGKEMVFPALWGDNSYNWGAGMHTVSTAAAFIKANMPLGQGNTLTDQDAWDVAYYMNAHDRPQDPRYNGSLEETRKKFHNEPGDLYGAEINGVVLGKNAPPSGGDLRSNTP